MAEQEREQNTVSSAPNNLSNSSNVQSTPQEQSPTSVKIVMTANNHLGHTIAGQRRRDEQLQRLRDAFQQATSFAVAQGANLFIQAGDLFDTTTPGEQDRTFVASCLARLKQAGIPVIALGGTHDTPVSTPDDSPLAPQRSYAQLGALHYFSPLAYRVLAGQAKTARQSRQQKQLKARIPLHMCVPMSSVQPCHCLFYIRP